MIDNNNEELELRKQQFRLVLIILAVLFVLFFSFTLYFCINYYKSYNFFNKTQAEVVDHEVIDGIEYDVLEYVVDGNEFRITSDYESKNHIEDIVTIYYAQDNPVGVIYELDSRRISLPIITLLFGLATIGLFVLYFINYNSNKNSDYQSEIVVDNKAEKVKIKSNDNKLAKTNKGTNTVHKTTNKQPNNRKSNNKSKVKSNLKKNKNEKSNTNKKK